MGFSGLVKPSTPSKPTFKGLSIDFLHTHGCKVCPLNKLPGNANGQMEPTGATEPLIYVLGAAPTKADDRNGEPFSAVIGDYIRDRIPEEMHDLIRWNNVVRTFPQKPDIETVAIECCKPSIVTDIEESKPKAIFGIGPVPLKWVINENSISSWRGRRVPVKIGDHTCWYYPMLDPDYIRYALEKKRSEGIGLEFTFEHDMHKALREIGDLPAPVVHTKERAIADIEIITGSRGWADVDRVKALLERNYDAVNLGYDYETNKVRPYANGAKLLSVAMSSQSETFAFALRHKQAKWTKAQLADVETSLKLFLLKSRCRKISHNLPFELEWTAFFFGRLAIRKKTWGDSIGASYILDERPKTHDLGFMTMLYFGLDIKLIDNLDKSRLDDEPIEIVLRYNGLDARYHRLVYNAEVRDLKAQKLWQVYQHQLRRAHAVVLTQIKGIPVDQTAVLGFAKKYRKEMRRLERLIEAEPMAKRFRKIKQIDYRPSSPHDIKFIIQKILKLPFETADEKVLQQVKHPIAKLTLEWRKVSKLYSTYVQPYMEGKSADLWPDHLLHPILAITSTRTWRTSAKGPNVQNQPKRNKEARMIRKQVKPGGEKRVVAFDYAGIQARNVAMESEDKTLVKYFWEKYDIHTDWMNRLVELYPKWIDGGVKMLQDKDLKKSYRNRAKNEFVFPSFFGAMARTVAGHLGVPEHIGEQMHDAFWDEFPWIKGWHERLHKEYRKTGYVTGLSGFRRRCPISPNEVINSPIQSDESLIVMTAMCCLSELGDMRFQPNIEIHDDLTFIWEKSEIERNAEIVVREMTKKHFPWINVPLVVEMSVGADWASLETVGEYSSADWNGKVLYTLEKPKIIDPNNGSWADGTGWANHKRDENSTKQRGKHERLRSMV